MDRLIYSFDDLTPDVRPLAGPKAAVLGLLHQKGCPVPDGFVVLPDAFSGERLSDDAWPAVTRAAQSLAGGHPSVAFAVRSSAAAEDSARASFAGEFESRLEVPAGDALRSAVEAVWGSRTSSRVQAYSQAHGLASGHCMAVIVQRMVGAELSGVLFTADPVAGSGAWLCGNFVTGLGERLVSGQADAHAFRIMRGSAEYAGPKSVARFARTLHDLALRVEAELGAPLDIEWATADGCVLLLQARPITTPLVCNPVTGERNDSLSGGCLWSSVNFGEAIPGVMTPLTASAIERGPVAELLSFDGRSAYGCIGGRPYLNISVLASLFRCLGRSRRQIAAMLDEMALTLPEDLEIPLLPLSAGAALDAVGRLLKAGWRQQRCLGRVARLLSESRDICADLRLAIDAAETQAELGRLWRDRVEPRLGEVWLAMLATASHHSRHAAAVRRELIALVGGEDADVLSASSGASAGGDLLASLGPAVGLARVRRGEMAPSDYLERYGHRGPDELELSAPRPAEGAGWLDRELARQAGDPDADDLLARQRQRCAAALTRLEQADRKRAPRIGRKLAELTRRAKTRESVRSEYVRMFGVWRAWALKVGAVTGAGDDVFFLTQDEVLRVLEGARDALAHVARRKATYERYRALPAYPPIIKGRFDPMAWAADAGRRSDRFDQEALPAPSPAGAIRGIPASAGRVEGVVRVLSSLDEADELKAGEILVTAKTNVGWTLLFPRAAAVVTDVGAPLSHAAIVARELGIPAVVGCGDATRRLRSGDRVRLDGSTGVVEIRESGDTIRISVGS